MCSLRALLTLTMVLFSSACVTQSTTGTCGRQGGRCCTTGERCRSTILACSQSTQKCEVRQEACGATDGSLCCPSGPACDSSHGLMCGNEGRCQAATCGLAGMRCCAGTCLNTGVTCCSDVCVDTRTDQDNCRICGSRCSGRCQNASCDATAACGAVGVACCTTGRPCGDGASCMSGTCRSNSTCTPLATRCTSSTQCCTEAGSPTSCRIGYLTDGTITVTCCKEVGRACTSPYDCCGNTTCDNNVCVAVGEGEYCSQQLDCATGLTCQFLAGETSQRCSAVDPCAARTTCGGATRGCTNSGNCGFCDLPGSATDYCAGGSENGPQGRACSGTWVYYSDDCETLQ